MVWKENNTPPAGSKAQDKVGCRFFVAEIRWVDHNPIPDSDKQLLGVCVQPQPQCKPNVTAACTALIQTVHVGKWWTAKPLHIPFVDSCSCV